MPGAAVFPTKIVHRSTGRFLIEQLRRKATYIILQALLTTAEMMVFIASRLRRHRRPIRAFRRIAAVWYYPPEMPGSNLRLGYWQSFFEQEGYIWDNFHVGSFSAFVD